MSGLFKLDGDHRSDLVRLVRLSLPRGWLDASTALSERVEVSVCAWFLARPRDVTPEGRAHLERLVQLLTSSRRPVVGVLRAKAIALHPSLVQQVEARASRLVERIPTFLPIASDFRGWVKTAPAAELIPTMQRLLIDGRCRVVGRNRPNGKQSRSRTEPSIAALPNTRKNAQGHAGGRPERDDLRLLISFLAIDWLQSTGLQPDEGRSDHTPFGALVFMVFRWIGEEDKAAHSLRTYWSPPRPRPKKKPSAALSQG